MSCCVFFGHSDFLKNKEFDMAFENTVFKLIKNGVTEFYSGGYGNFDNYVIYKISEIKKQYPYIENYLVLPYLQPSYVETFKYLLENTLAKTIYPFEHKTMPKFAIVERNKWMVKKADIVVTYVNYKWGGAFKMYKLAKSKNKNIINLGTLTI